MHACLMIGVGIDTSKNRFEERSRQGCGKQESNSMNPGSRPRRLLKELALPRSYALANSHGRSFRFLDSVFNPAWESPKNAYQVAVQNHNRLYALVSHIENSHSLLIPTPYSSHGLLRLLHTHINPLLHLLPRNLRAFSRADKSPPPNTNNPLFRSFPHSIPIRTPQLPHIILQLGVPLVFGRLPQSGGHLARGWWRLWREGFDDVVEEERLLVQEGGLVEAGLAVEVGGEVEEGGG